jgi:putative MATE family efflux protein
MSAFSKLRLKEKLGDSISSVDMTNGNIRKIIISFAIPIMVGNLFQQMYSMVDTAVVGRGVGSGALAAVGTTSPVIQLLLGLIIGMTSGMSVVIAQYFGSGETKNVKTAIANGIVLLSILTVLITVVGIVSCRSLFRLINTPEELVDGAVIYTVIMFSGTISTAAYNYEAAVLRAFGNSIIPLIFLVLTSLLNIGLDLLFVLVFDMGIAGAAIATVLSQMVSAVLCILYMRKSVDYVTFQAQDWKFNKKIWKEHLQTGIPMAFFSSLLAVSFLVLQAALNALGSNDMAAYTAASKMDTLVYQILGAFGTAISTFAAQNYGKGEFNRVREGVRKSLSLTIVISICMTVFVFLFGRYFMMLFIDGSETEIMESGMMYMRTTSMFYIILGINFIVRFALTGVGKTIIPMMVGISEILTRAAVTYLLVYRIGFLGMTFASPACWFTSTLLCVVCYGPMMRSAFRKYDRLHRKPENK